MALGLPIGAAAAYAAWEIVPAPFEAESEIHIKSFDDQLVFQTSEAQADFRTRKQTNQRMVTSPLVLAAALRKKDVASTATLSEAPDPVEWLVENLKVAEGGTEFFTISLQGERPKELKLIVEAVTEAFLYEATEGSASDRQSDLKKVMDVSDGVKTDLDQLHGRLKRLIGETHTSTTVMAEQKHNSLLLEHVNLRQRIADVEMKLLDAEASREARSATGNVADEIPDATLDLWVKSEPEYLAVTGKIDLLKSWLRRMEGRLSPTHKDIAEANRRIGEAEKELATLRETLRPKIVERIRQDQDARVAMTEKQFDEQVAHLKALKEQFQQRLDTIKLEEQQTGVDSLELENLDREIAQKEAMDATLTSEIERRKIELDAQRFPVSVWKEAHVPSHPDTKKRMAATGAAGLGGFGLIAIAIVLLDSLGRRISSVKEVSGELSVRLIGSIPAMPRSAMNADPARGRRSEKIMFWQNALKESVDAARTLILTEAERSELQVLMIASAVASEGKTTLACHLATSLARAGRSVVLVDCDLRRPTIDRVFGLDAESGLSELLRGESDCDEVVRSVGLPGLSVVTAGDVDPVALERLASGELGTVLAQLREKFEFIIVDTPPVLPVCDASLVARHADAVMLAVRRDVSRLAKVAATLSRFSALGVPVLGAVTIGMDDDPVGYGGYYRSRRRYGYTPEYLVTTG